MCIFWISSIELYDQTKEDNRDAVLRGIQSSGPMVSLTAILLWTAGGGYQLYKEYGVNSNKPSTTFYNNC